MTFYNYENDSDHWKSIWFLHSPPKNPNLFITESNSSSMADDQFYFANHPQSGTFPEPSETEIFKNLQEKINHLKELGPNWDEYGAEPPNTLSMEKSLEFLKLSESIGSCWFFK